MVTELARRSIPQALVNARLSERSHKRWNLAPSLARLIFGRFSLVMAQSDADAARLAAVGATQPVITGNIKFDCQPLGVDQAELARMRLLIGDRPVLLAASTHAGEEAVVAAAARRIAARVTGLLTIIVPRHPDRRTDIADALALDGFKVALRSRGEDVRPETDVYLADTLGELGLFYRLASVALIGGSLIPAGGHNPIEAAQLDTAVLHGPHVHNAREIFTALDRSGGALEVRDAEELADAVTRLLKSPVDARAMARAGSELVLSGRGALERSCGFISEYLIAGGSDGRRAHNDRGQATG
jgi:3-deoxy-D-manno-octulosonic-acid transferase